MTATLHPDTWRRSPLRMLMWATPTALLIAPAVAMQFTREVQWTAFDFVFAAVLLFGEKLKWNHLAAFVCLVAAVAFIFADRLRT